MTPLKITLGTAQRARWFLVVTLLCTACSSDLRAREPVAHDDEVVTVRNRVRRVLDMAEWEQWLGAEPPTLTEEVNGLLMSPRAAISTVLREETEEWEDAGPSRRQRALNLARLIAGVDRAPRTTLRGRCIRECNGVVFWDELPVPTRWLDKYETLSTPGILPEPSVSIETIEVGAKRFVPKPLAVIEGLMSQHATVYEYVARGRGAGLGLEIGMLAQRDSGLCSSLLAAAESNPRDPLVRDVLAVALAAAGVQDSEPTLQRWLREAEEANGPHMKPSSILVRAVHFLSGD